MKESNGAYCYFHPKEMLVGVCPLCLNERLLILAAKQGLKSSKSHPITSNVNIHTTTNIKSKPSISNTNSLPAKIFALGSLLHLRDVRHRRRRKSDLHDNFVDFADDLDTTSTSLEDESFISIKFGENGVPSWDKGTNNTTVSNSKVTLEHCSMSWGTGQTLVKDNANKNNNNKGNIGNIHNNNKSVVEHAKPRAAALRWRKRVGQLLQVIRWRRSKNKGNVGGVVVGGESSSTSNSSIRGERVMKVGRNDKGWIMRTLKMRTNS